MYRPLTQLSKPKNLKEAEALLRVMRSYSTKNSEVKCKAHLVTAVKQHRRQCCQVLLLYQVYCPCHSFVTIYGHEDAVLAEADTKLYQRLPNTIDNQDDSEGRMTENSDTHDVLLDKVDLSFDNIER